MTLSCSGLSFVTYNRKQFQCRHRLYGIHHGTADGPTQTPWTFGDIKGVLPLSHRIKLSRQAKLNCTFTLTYTPEVITFPPTEFLQMRPMRSLGSDRVPLPPLWVGRTGQNWVPGLTSIQRQVQILICQVSLSPPGTVERGWCEATEWENAKIQAGLAFSIEIPHFITALPVSQTGGNNGPAQLCFPVREPNVM